MLVHGIVLRERSLQKKTAQRCAERDGTRVAASRWAQGAV